MYDNRWFVVQVRTSTANVVVVWRHFIHPRRVWSIEPCGIVVHPEEVTCALRKNQLYSDIHLGVKVLELLESFRKLSPVDNVNYRRKKVARGGSRPYHHWHSMGETHGKFRSIRQPHAPSFCGRYNVIDLNPIYLCRYLLCIRFLLR